MVSSRWGAGNYTATPPDIARPQEVSLIPHPYDEHEKLAKEVWELLKPLSVQGLCIDFSTDRG
jgi:hypothetical protein